MEYLLGDTCSAALANAHKNSLVRLAKASGQRHDHSANIIVAALLTDVLDLKGDPKKPASPVRKNGKVLTIRRPRSRRKTVVWKKDAKPTFHLRHLLVHAELHQLSRGFQPKVRLGRPSFAAFP
jgi:hypothetical protein